MATSLESKLSELEARLKAENEAVMRDKMPREPYMHSPASRRQRSFGENGMQDVAWPPPSFTGAFPPRTEDIQQRPGFYCESNSDQHRSSPQIRNDLNSMNNVNPRSPRVARPSLSLDGSGGEYQGPGRPVFSQSYQSPKSPGRHSLSFSGGQTQSPQLSRPNYSTGIGQPSSPQLAKQTMRLSISESQDMTGRPMFYLGSGSPSPGRMPSTYERQHMNGPPPRDSPSPGNPRYGYYDGPMVPPRRLSLEQGQSPQSPRNSPSPVPRNIPQGGYTHPALGPRNSYDSTNGAYPRDSPSPGPPPPPRQNSSPFVSPAHHEVLVPRRSTTEVEQNVPSAGAQAPGLVRSSSDVTNTHVSRPERPSLNFGSSRDGQAMRPTRPSLSMDTVQEGQSDNAGHRRPNLNFEFRSPPQRDCQSPSRFRESPSPSRTMRESSSPGPSRPRQSPSPGPSARFVVGPAFALGFPDNNPTSGDPPPTPPRRPSLNFSEFTNQTGLAPDISSVHHQESPRQPTASNEPATSIPQSPSPARPVATGPIGATSMDSPGPARRPNLNLGGPPGSNSPQLNRAGRAGRPTLQIGSQREGSQGGISFGGTLGSFPGFGGSFGSQSSFGSPSPSPSPSGAPNNLGRPGNPGMLNFVSPGATERRMMRGRFQLPGSPQAGKPPESAEIEMKYQEIMKQSGILTINDKRIPTDINDLQPLGELGHGTCGHVVKMRHAATGYCMAVKQMRRSGNRDENKRIIMDLDVVIKSHSCPFIVQCLGTFITSSDVWICMELMNTCWEKLLKRYKKPIPEKMLGKVAVATVNALNYLKEEHGVIHRDIKPSNILLDERGRILLCDFGISGRLVDSKAKTRSAGCAAYMAPERIDPPDPTKPDYDIRADVWSLGISLVELATGVFPYPNCKTDFEVLAKVLEEDPPMLPAGKGFSINFCSFVSTCLTKDYKKRPKYRKLLDHAFIRYYTTLHVDVAAWYAVIQADIAKNNPTLTPSPGQVAPQCGF